MWYVCTLLITLQEPLGERERRGRGGERGFSCLFPGKLLTWLLIGKCVTSMLSERWGPSKENGGGRETS
jgi:hypothetical protein